MQTRLKTDPFTISIVKNALISAAEEMFTVTARTAQSPIIYDVLDFSTAITDHEGNVTAQATGIPLFIGIFDYTVKGVIGKYGLKEFRDGDVIVLNDPYMSGKHAKITQRMGVFLLEDCKSRNGVYRRIQSETEVVDGDEFFLGEELFRVEIKTVEA